MKSCECSYIVGPLKVCAVMDFVSPAALRNKSSKTFMVSSASPEALQLTARSICPSVLCGGWPPAGDRSRDRKHIPFVLEVAEASIETEYDDLYHDMNVMIMMGQPHTYE